MLKMVDGTGIIGVDMICPLGVSTPQPPNYDKVEMEGVGSLMLPNSLKAPLERVELLGNSTQGENPAPDNPQEIKSAGRKSKNLLIENISVFTVQDNIAYIPLPEGHETKPYTMLIQKKPGENDDVGFTCGFYDKSNMTATYSAPCLQAGNLVTGNGIVNSKIGVNHFVCFSPADSRFFDIYNVMYAEGKETTLDYEPYGYFFDLKITGKNLFDREKARDITNWIVRDGNGYAKFPIRVGKGNKVTFYYSEKLTTGKGFYVGITQSETSAIVSWLYHSAETNLNNKKYTAVAAGDYIYLSCTISGIQKFVDTIQTLQVEIGSEQTEYEPYTEQTVQIALDEPLRGVGEYKDVLTKDGVVRKIKRIVFDGSENWVIHKEKETTVSFWTNSFKFLFPTHNTMLVDKFAYVISGMNKEDVSWSVYGSNFYININKDIASNLESFKIWLSKNTVTVEYIAIEPTTEPLPESVQQQLQALHSENGVTHVFVDSGEVPCGIKLTYRKEK